MFYFLRKKIVVDCFVNHPVIAELHAVRKGIKSTPEWWRKLETFYTRTDNIASVSVRQNTMRSCQGFVDLYRSSWTLPLWMDISVRTSDEGGYTYLTPHDMGIQPVSYHDPRQYGNNFQSLIQLKFTSPWLLFEKKGLKFAFMGAEWEFLQAHPEVRSTSGIMEFKRNHSTNLNVFLPKKNAEYHFLAGMPLIYIIPLTEREVEFRTHCVTDMEYREVMKRSGLMKISFDRKRNC